MLGAVPIPLPVSAWWALIVAALLAIYGIQVVLDGFQATFSVSTNGGQHYSLHMTLTSKRRAQELAEQVNTAIVRLHTHVVPRMPV